MRGCAVLKVGLTPPPAPYFSTATVPMQSCKEDKFVRNKSLDSAKGRQSVTEREREGER